jgi:thiol-disulfide isomerase/thioredoxin
MVPSCRFTGNRLENFALNDLEGRPWQFRQRSGRLMLLDFWGTWCTPCIQAIPHLVNLQKRHGAYGLEVVGVACERSGPQESVRRVRDVQRRFNMNYRVLLADLGDRCPLQAQLGIEQFPTLILVDSEGRIVWRGVGSDRLAELDAAIHHHLRR